MGIFSPNSAFNSADLYSACSISPSNLAKLSSHSYYNLWIYSSSSSYSALMLSSMFYNKVIKSPAGSPAYNCTATVSIIVFPNLVAPIV